MEVLEKAPKMIEENRALEVRARAVAIIKNDDQAREAGAMLVEVNRTLKQWESLLDPVVAAAYKTHKEATWVKNEVAAPLESAKRLIGAGLAGYKYEQKRRAQEEAARIQAEIKKQQEEIQIAQAEQLEKAGNRQLAEAVISAPVIVPTIAPQTFKADGVSFRSTWDAEIIDLLELCKAVAADAVSVRAIKPDMMFLNSMARNLKGEMRIPGVRSVETRSAVTRGAF